jgi:predicted ArsR family transcriptional regulator
MTVNAELPDNLVWALTIKGSALLDGLASAVGSKPEHVQSILNRLMKEGLVERSGSNFRLSVKGKPKGRRLLAAEGRRWGTENAAAALDAFHGLDLRMKETITAWQLREIAGEQVINDHTDERYDARVLGRLMELHQDARAWVSSLRAAPKGIRLYLDRLTRALQSARSDPRFVASPTVDSCHSVWFEFHEALILLAGRKRADEAAAGRA